jgi:hypothetical protein
LQVLTELGRAHVVAGNAAAALSATQRAARLHRALKFSPVSSNPAALWWRHSQALEANGRIAAAGKALEQAWQLLLGRIASLGDEGLRRNYLNKRVREPRDRPCVALACGQRKLPRKRREAHLAGKANLSESFERLVDTGLRLNEIKTEKELHEFLVDEVTELSGAERVLLILEARMHRSVSR